MPGDIMSKKEIEKSAIDIIYEFGLSRKKAGEYKLRNKLYGWQKKNPPCPHGFTKICRHGCFWSARHRKNMERVVEREIK